MINKEEMEKLINGAKEKDLLIWKTQKEMDDLNELYTSKINLIVLDVYDETDIVSGKKKYTNVQLRDAAVKEQISKHDELGITLMLLKDKKNLQKLTEIERDFLLRKFSAYKVLLKAEILNFEE